MGSLRLACRLYNVNTYKACKQTSNSRQYSPNITSFVSQILSVLIAPHAAFKKRSALWNGKGLVDLAVRRFKICYSR